MPAGGFTLKRLARLRVLLERHVDSGFVPGMVAVLARHGEVHVEATGTLAFDGAGSSTPMGVETICRMSSMTKPIVAACAMTLVEEGTLRLDDPVEELLPELADMAVLADPEGPLDDTVPARRSITLRDLLTFTLGSGMVAAEPGTMPIADALDALDPPPAPDEWIRCLGALPLIHQPGERWMYELGADVLVVLIARATGMSFGQALRERICEPLGMKDTGFSVASEGLSRLATAYQADDSSGSVLVEDAPDGYWRRPPTFESGGGGLVSTAEDFFAFASCLLGGGTHRGERVLSPPSVVLMTSDQLTPEQKAASGFWPGYFDTMGWGFGMSVLTHRTHLALQPGATDGTASTALRGSTTPPRTFRRSSSCSARTRVTRDCPCGGTSGPLSTKRSTTNHRPVMPLVGRCLETPSDLRHSAAVTGDNPWLLAGRGAILSIATHPNVGVSGRDQGFVVFAAGVEGLRQRREFLDVGRVLPPAGSRIPRIGAWLDGRADREWDFDHPLDLCQ